MPADEAHQLQSLRTELDEARSEIESLRPLADEREALRPELAELDELRPVRGPCEELGELRRAHEILQRRLVAERAAFAEGIAAVERSVFGSRSWRYTAPLRAALRRLKPR